MCSLCLSAMGFGQIIVIVCLLGLTLGSSEENARTTRTFGSFFGGGSSSKQQQVDQTAQVNANTYYNPYEQRPLVYQVKYYDTPVSRDVGRNTIDKAGEVRQEVGQQRVFFYTTNVPQQVPQQVQNQGVVQVPQGYVYVNPVVGGGQPQTYIVGQVGNQQVLVPCPVDYVYQTPVVPPVVEKVVPVKPAVVQPVVGEVKGREHQQYVYSQGPVRDVQSNKRPVGGVPEAVYNPYSGGYYGGYGIGSYAYPSYVNPYVGGVGYNYNYDYSPYAQDAQVVTVVPPGISPQASTNGPVRFGVGQPTTGATDANNPYVFYYRGGVSGYQPIYSPYVIPVPGVVRPKDQGQGQSQGSASTRVSVSSQGQQPQVVAQQQQQVQQQAEAKKTMGAD